MARSTEAHHPTCDALAGDLEWYLDSLDGSDGAEEGLPPLPADRRRALEGHLERCPACSRQLALAERLRGTLRALPAEVPAVAPSPRPVPSLPPPESALDDGSPTAGTPWRQALPWVATVGGALAAVVLAVILVQPLLVDSPPEPTAEELARAEAEARYALAQLAAVSRRAGRHLQQDVLMENLVEPTARHLRNSWTVVHPNPETPDSTTPALPAEPRR